MGIRVGFYFGGPDGLLSCFLNSPLDQFQNFLVEVLEEFPEDVSLTSLQLVKEVGHSGVSALHRATTLDYKAVDKLVTDWVLLLDIGHKYKLDSASDSWVSMRYYQELHEQLGSRGIAEVNKLLPYIFNGRPLLRDGSLYPFYSEDGVLRVGYWTAEEARLLKDALDESSQAPCMAAIREEGVLGIVEEVVAGAVQKNTGVIFVVC